MKDLNGPLNRRLFLKKMTQTTAVMAASAAMGPVLVPFLARADERKFFKGSRISYFFNGEIHVSEPGNPEGKPLTTGHMDFKPSWSKTGDQLIFFRKFIDDPETLNWKCAICMINVDGTGFHQFSDGNHTDFNPTWTRDGLNTPIWNWKNDDSSGGFHVMQSRVGNDPGQEVALTDPRAHTWAHSCLTDGRILVSSTRSNHVQRYYLMTRREGGNPLYERVQCELEEKGLLDRISVSPNEKKVCFDFIPGFQFIYPGRTLYIADFDGKERTLTNVKAIANPEGKKIWYDYPRWIEGGTAVVYHSGETGKNQLYVYRLEDGTTRRVSTNLNADYRYPHGEAAPC